ncbi:hypothetical protein E4S40_01515 [Algoriphagus kandeliae]|uniref:Type IX secretion system membrane protein PorP/SprF n=1 Tax=Algoriphagus kandeliae TaxID=2562278 RepID=A0A4Y9QY10_9BACT|nr:hypothetical protein [Algoriphagus kandeliae]TFV97361.1 hypothetical protein E4S40_01515 [Algoriphagus kandeliae]
MKAGGFLFFFLGILFSAFSQTDPLTQVHGAQNQGIGNQRVHLPSTWSYFNNIGALDRINKSGISVGYDHRFGLQELTTWSLAAAIKNRNGTFGFGISRFGGKLFNQQAIGIGYSHTLGINSIGLKMEYFQTQLEGFGSGGSLLFSLGGITELGPKVFLGANISNINGAKISKESNSRLPTLVQLGLHYLPIESLSLLVELEKDIQKAPQLKAGLEYRLQKWLSLRCGINSQPSRFFAGFSIQKGNLRLDYAYSQLAPLGSTNHLSLNYQWGD